MKNICTKFHEHHGVFVHTKSMHVHIDGGSDVAKAAPTETVPEMLVQNAVGALSSCIQLA